MFRYYESITYLWCDIQKAMLKKSYTRHNVVDTTMLDYDRYHIEYFLGLDIQIVVIHSATTY